MYSFYGGRPGNSFVIVTTFGDIQTMVNNFQQGPNYTEVHFDQHVMINNPNKNDPDNGKIFRRGYNFNNNMGGAEYIGTIIGPAGRAPELSLTTIADIQSKIQNENFEGRNGIGEYSIKNSNLIPGKDANGYHDSIEWAYCSIRNENEEDCTAYIGFKFPYPVIDFESEAIEPYDNGIYDDMTSVIKIEDTAEDENNQEYIIPHPFYHKFKITIPNGIKGDSIKNLKVETASGNIQDYDGKNDDVNAGRKVLVYDYYDYSNRQDGDPKKIYLGDYNMIQNIQVNEEGTVQITYTHNNKDTFEKIFKSIQQISLNDENGFFEIIYNYGLDKNNQDTTYQTQLNWVKNIVLDEDGTITINYTKNQPVEYANYLKTITSINLNDDGTLIINYNTGQSDQFAKKIKWIDYISMEDDVITFRYNDGSEYISGISRTISDMSLIDGDFVITYNDGNSAVFPGVQWMTDIQMNNSGEISVTYNNAQSEIINSNNPLKWINNIYTDANGKVKINWNRGSDTQLTDLKWINDIDINSDQQLEIEWNDGQTQTIGNPINYILEMAINNDKHLLVRYSDPAKRGMTIWNNKNDWSDLGTVVINTVSAGENYSNLGWSGKARIIGSGIEGAHSYLEFTIAPSRPVGDDIESIVVTTGRLQASYNSIPTEPEQGDIAVEQTNNFVVPNLNGYVTVTSTLTGLSFLVDMGVLTDEYWREEYADVNISGMGLAFYGA